MTLLAQVLAAKEISSNLIQSTFDLATNLSFGVEGPMRIRMDLSVHTTEGNTEGRFTLYNNYLVFPHKLKDFLET